MVSGIQGRIQEEVSAVEMASKEDPREVVAGTCKEEEKSNKAKMAFGD
jgi:hypothetical protein